jgi:hypothetical protein
MAKLRKEKEKEKACWLFGGGGCLIQLFKPKSSPN